jgi:hypothetical protein
MDELASPLSEGDPFASKNLLISDYPNVPACHHHNFHKGRVPKASPGLIYHILHLIMLVPIYLQIIPNSHNKITLKE